MEAGATNNAALSSAWIPAMVFGIPGDAVTAIAVGVLVMKGMDPGPQLLTMRPENFYAVLMVFFLANLLLLPFGFVAAKASRYLFSVPRAYLNSAILIFCVIGSYAINNSMFGVWVMIGLGVAAYVLEVHGFAIAPIILGIVLGPLLESNFTTSMMIARGDLLTFFERPVAAALGLLTLGVWLAVFVSYCVAARRAREVVRACGN